MSSTTVITGTPARGHNRYFRYLDGWATTKAQDDEVQLRWDLTDELASSETVSSASDSPSGVTVSSASASTPVVIRTISGLGYDKITATLSTGRTLERVFYFLSRDSAPMPSDYR